MVDWVHGGQMDLSSQEGKIVTDKSDNSSMTQKDEQSVDEFSFLVHGRPVPKGRPRMSRKGRVYTPAKTVSAEEEYSIAVGDDAPIFEGPVRVELTFNVDSTMVTIIPAGDWKSPLRGDLDNYIKLALDGIQRAGIIVNDSQVVHIDATKL